MCVSRAAGAIEGQRQGLALVGPDHVCSPSIDASGLESGLDCPAPTETTRSGNDASIRSLAFEQHRNKPGGSVLVGRNIHHADRRNIGQTVSAEAGIVWRWVRSLEASFAICLYALLSFGKDSGRSEYAGAPPERFCKALGRPSTAPWSTRSKSITDGFRVAVRRLRR